MTVTGVLIGGWAGGALVVVRVGRAYKRRIMARQRLVASAAAPRRAVAVPAWVVDRTNGAAIDLPPSHIALAWALTLLGAPLIAMFAAGPGAAVVALVVTGLGPVVALRMGAGRADRRVEAALPLALEAVARGLRTGASLRQAIGEAAATAGGPLALDLATVADGAAHGLPLADALDRWVARRPLSGVRLAAAALALGAETGGAQARAVDGVATTIRERLAAVAEARAQATQARASAAVIALAPLAFAAMATATDARTGAFLFHSAAGLILVTVGLGLDAIGALWMNRLTRVDA
jgi:tight adherence protein B